MAPLTIIDAFPAFLSFWERACALPMPDQINGWAADYMSAWPELLEKQIANYAEEGLDWRAVAAEHVFPFLPDRLPAMQRAHRNLRAVIDPLFCRAQSALGVDLDLNIVIYAGVGCGAGWATTYGGKRAVLFGLENIAEEGWTETETLEGLFAHELGHLIHFAWREQKQLTDGSGPFWMLYEEGFAQRCQDFILGTEDWRGFHSVDGSAWLPWCIENKGWLAAEFLRDVAAGEPVNRFFGSWFDIQGRKQTGYYLGHEVIRALEANMSLSEIAMLEPIDIHVRQVLEQFCE